MSRAVITLPDLNGSPTHCDSRCYDASGPDCSCCCGGLNHGKGSTIAAANAAEYRDLIQRQWKITLNRQHRERQRVIDGEPVQMDLF